MECHGDLEGFNGILWWLMRFVTIKNGDIHGICTSEYRTTMNHLQTGKMCVF